MDKLVVFRKTWEYLFWLRPTVERFSKVHRYSLGIEMQGSAMQLLRIVIGANYANEKSDLIERALVEHEVQ
ncbi:MAG TPA: four helix bundle protein [Candidatus Dormibacteraeota bacterium]|nr:four helix bundle protein [Candidatus Dormibacteraeota bacterium]